MVSCSKQSFIAYNGGVVTWRQLSLWQRKLQLDEHLNGCLSEKCYKAKLSSRTHVSLVRITLKRYQEAEKARNGCLDKQWVWPYIRDFMHKRSYVWYTEMLTQQWLSTIKRVFLCTMFCWWHTRTRMYLHNGTKYSLSKDTIAIAKAWAFYGCKKVKKCKMRQMVPFLMRGHICLLLERSCCVSLSEPHSAPHAE